MRFHFLAAVAAAAIAAPAAAQTGPYVGADLGGMLIQHDDAEYQGVTGAEDGPLDIHHKIGIDADINAGYDFGMFRLEGELGWKRASVDDVDYNNAAFGPLFGDGGHARTVSAMVNGLADFDLGTNVSAFVGGGAGDILTGGAGNDLIDGEAGIDIALFASTNGLGFSDTERKLWRNFALASFALLALVLMSPSTTAVDRIALYVLPIQIAVLSRVPRGLMNEVSGKLAVVGYSLAVQFVWLNFAAHAVSLEMSGWKES